MIDFKFADIGEGIHEGKILKWMVEEGSEVKDGETLFLVETDKVNAEIPSPSDGKIIKLMAKEGDTIHVGNVVVKIDDGDEETTESNDVIKELKNENTKEAVNEEETAGVVGELTVSSDILESSDEVSSNRSKDTKKKVLATPVARKLAKDLGIDINTVNGTGPVGRVMKADIYKVKEENDNKDIKAIKEEKTVNRSSGIEVPNLKVTGAVERVPLSMLRKTIAKNMVLSKTLIPHATAMDDFDVTDLVKFRNDHKKMANEREIHLTYMPFIIKALTLTLKKFPVFNASFDERAEEIILKKYYHIGIATDTPDGLIVPVIKDADRKGILEIADELGDLSEAARNKTISVDKLQDGTITITNFGAVGSLSGIPVIKHPELAILGIGKITKKPVVFNNEITIRDIMSITLCIDHRVIDGADAGRFLIKLKEYLSNPMLLLIS